MGVFPAGSYRERACGFAEAPAALPGVQHGPRLAAGIVLLGAGKQPAQPDGDKPGGLRYPGRGQCQYEGRRSRVPQVRYYGMGRVRGAAGGVGDFVDDQYGGAKCAEDDERPTYRAVSPDSVGPASSWISSCSMRRQGWGSGVSGWSFILWPPCLDDVKTGIRS